MSSVKRCHFQAKTLMFPTKPLVRVARRLQDVWHRAVTLAERDLDQLLTAFDNRQQLALQQARRRLDLARTAKLLLIQPDLCRQVLACTQELYKAADLLQTRLERPMPFVPPIRFLLDELRQIEADFGGLTVDWKGKAVCAVTEPITLEGVYLGPFALRFCWERLTQAADHFCFDIVAMDPHPADSNSNVTHPHVSRHQICAGDAAMPVKAALGQGRLADAFHLLRSVLLTYNAHSPHVHLAEWGGTRCHDCGRAVSVDDLSTCEGCNDDLCADCTSVCSACGNSRCSHCLTACMVCEEEFCGRCLLRTAISRRRCCAVCRRYCPGCTVLFAADEAADGNAHCPTCRTRAAVAETTQPVGVNAAAGTQPHPSVVEIPHAPTLDPAFPASTPD
jgi:hypothetical protein